MYEKYQELFELYLGCLKEKYKSEDSIENAKICCKRCASYQYKLIGMLDLMQKMHEITWQKREEEWDKVMETFSSINLFGIYIREGQLYGCERR